MARRPRHPRTITLLGLVPVVMFVFGLGRAEATSVAAGSAVRGGAADHVCGCGTKCAGAACCCDHDDSAPSPAVDPAPAPTRSGSGACLSAAPCGTPAIPTAQHADPLGKAPALAFGGLLATATSGRHLLASPRYALPSRRASRLDDPPESRLPA